MSTYLNTIYLHVFSQHANVLKYVNYIIINCIIIMRHGKAELFGSGSSASPSLRLRLGRINCSHPLRVIFYQAIIFRFLSS